MLVVRKALSADGSFGPQTSIERIGVSFEVGVGEVGDPEHLTHGSLL